jgi:hypothetical protein
MYKTLSEDAADRLRGVQSQVGANTQRILVSMHKYTFLPLCLLVHALQVRLYDGELEAARWCALEEASLSGSRLLAYLPGSILVNRSHWGRHSSQTCAPTV